MQPSHAIEHEAPARGRSAMHIQFVITSINIWPGAEASCISTFVRGRSTMHSPFGISSINIWPEAADKRCAATRANFKNQRPDKNPNPFDKQGLVFDRVWAPRPNANGRTTDPKLPKPTAREVWNRFLVHSYWVLVPKPFQNRTLLIKGIWMLVWPLSCRARLRIARPEIRRKGSLNTWGMCGYSTP